MGAGGAAGGGVRIKPPVCRLARGPVNGPAATGRGVGSAPRRFSPYSAAPVGPSRRRHVRRIAIARRLGETLWTLLLPATLGLAGLGAAFALGAGGAILGCHRRQGRLGGGSIRRGEVPVDRLRRRSGQAGFTRGSCAARCECGRGRRRPPRSRRTPVRSRAFRFAQPPPGEWQTWSASIGVGWWAAWIAALAVAWWAWAWRTGRFGGRDEELPTCFARLALGRPAVGGGSWSSVQLAPGWRCCLCRRIGRRWRRCRDPFTPLHPRALWAAWDEPAPSSDVNPGTPRGCCGERGARPADRTHGERSGLFLLRDRQPGQLRPPSLGGRDQPVVDRPAGGAVGRHQPVAVGPSGGGVEG